MESVNHRYRRVWVIQFLLMTALWFLFVAKIEWAEALVGFAAAALAATGDAVIRRGQFAKFKPKVLWLAEFWREPGYVFSDTAIVFWILLQRLLLGKEPASILRRIPFDPGGNTA